jgi:hypothetical protein
MAMYFMARRLLFNIANYTCNNTFVYLKTHLLYIGGLPVLCRAIIYGYTVQRPYIDCT